jgi:hypothetical protein
LFQNRPLPVSALPVVALLQTGTEFPYVVLQQYEIMQAIQTQRQHRNSFLLVVSTPRSSFPSKLQSDFSGCSERSKASLPNDSKSSLTCRTRCSKMPKWQIQYGSGAALLHTSSNRLPITLKQTGTRTTSCAK